MKDFYTPKIFRKQSEDNKQASEGEVDEPDRALKSWENAMWYTRLFYEDLLERGVGKELARCILPLNQYTEVYWTASFQAVMNFIELRDEKTSQWEIQEYARVLKKMMLSVYPKTTEIWSDLYWS